MEDGAALFGGRSCTGGAGKSSALAELCARITAGRAFQPPLDVMRSAALLGFLTVAAAKPHNVMYIVIGPSHSNRPPRSASAPPK